jgi:hypothetical protein
MDEYTRIGRDFLQKQTKGTKTEPAAGAGEVIGAIHINIDVAQLWSSQ